MIQKSDESKLNNTQLKKHAKQADDMLAIIPNLNSLQDSDKILAKQILIKIRDTIRSELNLLGTANGDKQKRINVFKIKKIKKNGKLYEYWQSSWRCGRKVHSVYLGTCKKMDREQALKKAKELRRLGLGHK